MDITWTENLFILVLLKTHACVKTESAKSESFEYTVFSRKRGIMSNIGQSLDEIHVDPEGVIEANLRIEAVGIPEINKPFTLICHIQTFNNLVNWENTKTTGVLTSCTPSVCTPPSSGRYTFTVSGNSVAVAISSLQDEDYDTWTCSLQTNKVDYLLVVAVPFISVSINPQGQQDVDLSQPSTFICITFPASRPAPTISWYRQRRGENATMITTNITQRTTPGSGGQLTRYTRISTLSYYSAMADIDAIILCKASIDLINLQKTSNIASLNVRYIPIGALDLEAVPPGFQYINGTLVTLTCKIEGGNPLATLSWICLGQPVPGMNQSTTTVAKSVLTVNFNNTYDGQGCTCTANHTTNRFYVEKSVSFKMLSPAVVLSITLNGSNTVHEGSSVHIKCRIESSRPSNISWMNMYTQTILKSDVNVSESDLMLQSASCIDTGQYTCSAYNGIGTSSNKSLNLDVLCAPKLFDRQNDIENPNAQLGTKLEVSLSLISNPIPTIKWFYQKSSTTAKQPVLFAEVEIENSGVVFTTKLKKEITTKSDFGLYTVSALNSHGSIEHTFNVIENNEKECDCSGVSGGSIALLIGGAMLCLVSVCFFTIAIIQKRKINTQSMTKADDNGGGNSPFYNELNAAQINKKESTYDELQGGDSAFYNELNSAEINKKESTYEELQVMDKQTNTK